MNAVSQKRRGWLRYLPFFVLAGFLAAAFLYREGLEARATVGEPAPAFQLETLDGSQAALDDFSGKPVIINFWTTWCPECHDEAPALEAFHQAYGDQVTVLGVNMREPPAVAAPFVDRYGMSFPILMDRLERVSKLYRVTGVPETWFIDAQGTARWRHLGPITLEQLEAAALQLLAGAGDQGV